MKRPKMESMKAHYNTDMLHFFLNLYCCTKRSHTLARVFSPSRHFSHFVCALVSYQSRFKAYIVAGSAPNKYKLML